MSLKLFFAPRTRSFTGLWLMEELGEPYELASFDISTGQHRQPEYLALNPMGKVPMVVVDGLPVSELGAMAIYLGDRFPGSGLAPAIDSPDRAAFLRWCFFASAVMEPAFMEKATKQPSMRSRAAWGDFDLMVEVLTAGVAQGPWLLGETFSAADVLVGSNVRFGVRFGFFDFPEGHAVSSYLARLEEREALQRTDAIEAREGARFPMPEP